MNSNPQETGGSTFHLRCAAVARTPGERRTAFHSAKRHVRPFFGGRKTVSCADVLGFCVSCLKKKLEISQKTCRFATDAADSSAERNVKLAVTAQLAQFGKGHTSDRHSFSRIAGDSTPDLASLRFPCFQGTRSIANGSTSQFRRRSKKAGLGNTSWTSDGETSVLGIHQQQQQQQHQH